MCCLLQLFVMLFSGTVDHARVHYPAPSSNLSSKFPSWSKHASYSSCIPCYTRFVTGACFPGAGMRCIDCGYNCHEKCVPHVPKNCSRLRPVSEISDSNTTLSKASISETASVTGGQCTSSLTFVTCLRGELYSASSVSVLIIEEHILVR